MSEIYNDVLQAITKINGILSEFRNKYPDVKQSSNMKIENEGKALKIIKRIEAIIKNYNEENAERKLKSLIGLLGEEIIK